MSMPDSVSCGMKPWAQAILVAFAVLSCAGCSGSGRSIPGNQPPGGEAYGGDRGTALGSIIDRENPMHGALAGAAGGALEAKAVGRYMDRQKKTLQASLSPEIRAGEAKVLKLPDNAIQVTMTPGSAFAPGSAVVDQNFMSTLQKVATVVKDYGRSTVAVIGYPDSVAPDTATLSDQAELADERAEAVREMLIDMGIMPALVTASGNPRGAGDAEVIIQPLVARS